MSPLSIAKGLGVVAGLPSHTRAASPDPRYFVAPLLSMTVLFLSLLIRIQYCGYLRFYVALSVAKGLGWLWGSHPTRRPQAPDPRYFVAPLISLLIRIQYGGYRRFYVALSIAKGLGWVVGLPSYAPTASPRPPDTSSLRSSV